MGASNQDLPSYHDSQEAQAARVAAANAGLSTVHESFLSDSSGSHKWLVLRTKTRPRKPESLPIVREGDEISGTVELDLERGETAKSVTISVIGGTTFVGQDESVFLKETQVLWTPADGKGSAKLIGKHTWTFSFTLPKQVEVKNEGKSGMHNLPPTFTQRVSTVYVDYRLLVQIKRGFLKVDKALMTAFGYQLNTVSEPPSLLRQAAYAAGTPLLGPKDDPSGWKVLPSVKIKGSVSGANPTEVEITLALATPTTYALGGPVPLLLTLNSEDSQALDLLAKPEAICLELVRSMATGADAVDDTSTGRSDNYFYESEGFAFWWAASEADESQPNERTFRGEVEVPKNVNPTFLFPRCSFRYSLDLLPIVAPGWVNSPDNQRPLLSERIKVVSRQALGVKVRSDAPPGYDKSMSVNYIKSFGLLENGNQRFLHTHR